MTFTEEDANNDGLIKREVGREMAKVAQTQNPEVYEHFVRVCEEVGREPADVFGEMAVRALDNEAFANQVLHSELSMKQLRADEIRLEDVQYVKQLSEELGLNEQEEQKDSIDKLIDQRLESITRSPVPRLNREGRGGGGSDRKMEQYLEKMDSKLEQMENRLEEGENERREQERSMEEESKSTDDLFDSIDVEEEQEQPEAEQVEEEPEVSDEQIEEAMEGTEMEMEDATESDDDDDNPFQDIGEEVEVEERDDTEEGDGEDNPFSSTEAKEE